MTKEYAMNQAILHILDTAGTMDEAKRLYHQAIDEIFLFEFEKSDKQLEFNWSHDKVIDKGEKVGA